MEDPLSQFHLGLGEGGGGTWLSKLGGTFSSTGQLPGAGVLTGWVSIGMWVCLSERSPVELTHRRLWSPTARNQDFLHRGRDTPLSGAPAGSQKRGTDPSLEGCKEAGRLGAEALSWARASKAASQAQHRCPRMPTASLLAGHRGWGGVPGSPGPPPHLCPPPESKRESTPTTKEKFSEGRAPAPNKQTARRHLFYGWRTAPPEKVCKQRQARVLKKPHGPPTGARGQLLESSDQS